MQVITAKEIQDTFILLGFRKINESELLLWLSDRKQLFININTNAKSIDVYEKTYSADWGKDTVKFILKRGTLEQAIKAIKS